MTETLRNLRLLVAYDGTDFRGFAHSDGVRTVEGDLRAAIERVVRHEVQLVIGGRTDAGVHGWGQVVSGRVVASTDLRRLVMSVNQLLRPAVAVRDAEWVDDDFDARFSATARSYRYHVWNDRVPNPLLVRSVWHVGPPLDVDAMNDAARHLVGDHEFGSFCRKPRSAPDMAAPSLRRVVTEAAWTHQDRHGSLLRFGVTASAFCHQMVRSMVGTLVDVGLGRIEPGSMPEVIAAGDRNAAGQVAPPQGLLLWHIDYDGQRWDESATQ